jgi:hypothetical protein
MPPDGRNESGRIPGKYGLVATPVEHSAFGPDIPRSLRTEWNVRDSQGTLILAAREEWDRGTTFTQEMCTVLDKPYLLAELDTPIESIHRWITANQIEILNIAGPRASASNNKADSLLRFLVTLFSAYK